MTVLAGGAVKAALEAAAKPWAQSTGNAVKAQYAPAGEMLKRVAAGERPDVLVIPAENLAAPSVTYMDPTRGTSGKHVDEVVLAGISIAGPLPAELQKNTVYAGVVMRGAKDREAAASLLEALSSARGREAFSSRGYGVP